MLVLTQLRIKVFGRTWPLGCPPGFYRLGSSGDWPTSVLLRAVLPSTSRLRRHGLLVEAGAVLPRVHLLVVRPLDEAIVQGGQRRPEAGPEPVDPVVARETPGHDGTPEAAGRVQRAPGKENACAGVVSNESPGRRQHHVVRRPGLRLPTKDLPVSSAMNNASPMPIGARKVSLDFSTASIRITKTSCAVRNISMKRPWATDVADDRMVVTFTIGPGNMASTSPAATMEASSWAGIRNAVRSHDSWPLRLNPNETCQSYHSRQPGPGSLPHHISFLPLLPPPPTGPGSVKSDKTGRCCDRVLTAGLNNPPEIR